MCAGHAVLNACEIESVESALPCGSWGRQPIAWRIAADCAAWVPCGARPPPGVGSEDPRSLFRRRLGKAPLRLGSGLAVRGWGVLTIGGVNRGVMTVWGVNPPVASFQHGFEQELVVRLCHL